MSNPLIHRLETELANLRDEKDQLLAQQAGIHKRLVAIEDLSKAIGLALGSLEVLPPQLLDVSDPDEPIPLAASEPMPTATHFERIVGYLSTSHKPRTIAEIEAGTGVPKTSVSAVLYRTHSSEFESHDTPSRAKAWSLKAKIQKPAAVEEQEIPF